MFSSPTAIRVLKKQDPSWLERYDLSSLKYLFLAGEPLDQPTSEWISGGLGVPVIDNYWQTETGWPIMATPAGANPHYGSAGQPVFGYDVRLINEETGEPLDNAGDFSHKGVVAIAPPLPPGCMQTVWGDDERFVKTYFSSVPGRSVYSTFDWGVRDKDGYYFILGRTDDVINVAGHRLGTREIEESISSHAAVAECAVVGLPDDRWGEVPVLVLVRQANAEGASLQVDAVLSHLQQQIARFKLPRRVLFMPQLPKSALGKVQKPLLQQQLQASIS
jgi:propionyl-CoA synthetase